MQPRKRLTDILFNSDRERLAGAWDSTKPADDLGPVPAGEYKCRVVDGYLFTAQTGTPGYKLVLEIIEGDFAGRRLWVDSWLTEAALPKAKRDLGKLGITNLEQLERPLPEGFVVNAKVALRRSDDGTEFNKVVRFDVVGIEPDEPEPFAPAPIDGEPDANGDGETCDSQGFDWRSGTQQQQDLPIDRGRGAYSQP